MKNIAIFSSAFIVVPAGRDIVAPLYGLPLLDDGKMLQLMNPSGKEAQNYALGFVGDQPRVRVDFESHRGSRKQSETDENAPVYGRADALFPGRG